MNKLSALIVIGLQTEDIGERSSKRCQQLSVFGENKECYKLRHDKDRKFESAREPSILLRTTLLPIQQTVHLWIIPDRPSELKFEILEQILRRDLMENEAAATALAVAGAVGPSFSSSYRPLSLP